MNAPLDFLLSAVYDATRLDHPLHLSDLRRSSLSEETIRLQKISDVPPHMIDQLLGFAAPKITSAYLLPFADPRGGWMEHVRMKVFPSITTENGTIKYLQPRHSGVRIYCAARCLLDSPPAILHEVRHGYLLTVACPCGVTFEPWVTAEDAELDLLRLPRWN
jgi:hypothetical protein